MKIIDQRGELNRSIGMYHGNPIYWGDLMRVAPDHRAPRLAQLLWKVSHRIHYLAYRLNKRAARREMDRWGIEHPFLKAVSAKTTETTEST